MKDPILKYLRSSAIRGLTALVVVLSLFAAVNPQTVQAATFTVTKTADTNDGVCDADCSLREAIRAANANPGADTITIPAGTYTLTLAGSDDSANLGDLDVTGPLAISGAGQGSTIIQAGASSASGIDKIFSFNPLGTGTGFAASLSNLTLRFGRNPETYANGNGFGGCFDFDTGTSGAGSLAMTNVTVTDCSTTDADGGGIAIFPSLGGTVTISNSIIQNNRAGTNANAASGLGGGIFFGTTNAGKTTNLTISGSTVANNQALGGVKQGGGIFAFGSGGTYNYQLHGVTITGNSAASDGGGIYSTAPLTIDNVGGPTVISSNSSGRSGGGIWLNHSNATSNISKVTISGNSAADGGGGIRLDSSAAANVLNLSFSRIVNNTAGSGKGSGLSVNNGTANATNNWWGCSAGPSAAPCDTAKVDPASGGGPAGTGSVTVTPWLRVLTTASPAALVTGQSSSLTASVNTNSNNQDVSANVAALIGAPVTWSAVGGSLSGQQGTIQASGTATATYTGTAALAGNLAAAKVDNDGTASGPNVAAITVNKAGTTTTITSDTPDPSNGGQPVAVNYSVTVNAPGAGTPNGNVTVSDGVSSCTGTVAAGTCSITLTTLGARTLTAAYTGDSNFTGSTSAGEPHTVSNSATTTAITGVTPFPASVVGQSVTVQYTVTPDGGSGTPTGNVTVSDGTQSCTATVAAGQCSITFTTAGTKTITATYAGDNSFASGTSGAVILQVGVASTATAITSDSPDPSNVNQAVTVNYSVTVDAPGAGIPTGNVTVSDGVDSCTGTAATGTCQLTLTSPGSRTLTATYAGDSNFAGSTSAGEPHTVTDYRTITGILSTNPSTSFVGQSVTVQYFVNPQTAGSGTPTGNVTVSDGTVSCTATIAAGQCSLTFTSFGVRVLTASYAGDGTFLPSSSAGFPFTVVPASTVTTITSDNPDPSNVGQAVTVNYTVTVQSPGAGIPTGNVTVSDGVDSCTGTVEAGTCSITLTTPGARTLTATYAGSTNFNSSTSGGEPHAVNRFPTTTNITLDTPDPSLVGQPVTVQYSVTAASGTPTGNVTVSDGTDTCTGTVAAGQCAITFTSAGAKSLTATYAGDSNFNGSTSAAEPHTVNPPDITPPDTTITGFPPNPSSDATPTFTFSGTDDVTPAGNLTYQCSVDGASFSACPNPYTTAPLADGSHTVQVRAVDASGNIDPTQAAYTWTVDTAAPTATINQASGQADPTNLSPIHFITVFSEPVTGFASGDVALSGTAGATAATVTQTAPNNGTTYDVAVSGMTLSGTVIAAIPANAATDLAGNGNAASTSTDNTVTFIADSIPPDSVIDSGPGLVTASTSATFTFHGSDNITPAASLTFACQLDGGAYAACASPKSYSGLALGSHTFNVRAIDAAGNTDPTPASYVWQIHAPTALLYNGDQIVVIGSTFKPAALLSSPAAACASSQTVTFTLDRNPLTGAAGAYTLGTATTSSGGQATLSAVSTTGWQPGVYDMTAAFAGTTACDPSSYETSLTAAGQGDSANGGGWYTLSGSGRINFGFTVMKVDTKCTSNCAYKGQLLLINNSKWRLKGTLTGYVKTSTSQGAASGVGDLYWWNASLNGGLGDWALAKSGVSFTANFFDSGKTGKSSTDAFGITIQYKPVAPQPSSLPNSKPQQLKGGDIKVR